MSFSSPARCPKAQNQIAFYFVMVRARRILNDLFDLWLIHLQLAVFVEEKLLLGLFDVSHHFNFFSRAPVINRALLRVGFVDHSLILTPNEIGLRGLEVGGCRIHLLEYAVESSSARSLCCSDRTQQRNPDEADDPQERFYHYFLFTQTR